MESYAAPNGWGTNAHKMQVDFSIVVNDTTANPTKHTIQLDQDFYYDPDCDTAPMPLPNGGQVESGAAPGSALEGYNCAGFDDGDDCHLIVANRAENRLYELYHATVRPNGTLEGGCLSVWDMTRIYDVNGRGQQCSSADAAGFPITPMLFTADEIFSGEIRHAIRLILPNDMIRTMKYVHPATHGTHTSGPDGTGAASENSIPYGGRMRLKANYPVNTLPAAAQVVARAMQKYGILVSDGGQVAITAASDQFSTHKYDALGFDSHSLFPLKATDFDVVEFEEPTDVTFDCQRTPITQ